MATDLTDDMMREVGAVWQCCCKIVALKVMELADDGM